jgi:hypothetical protein
MRNLITMGDWESKKPPSAGEVLGGFVTHGKELWGHISYL